MKRNLIIIAIILCGYGVAFSFAPPIPIPVPPPAIGPEIARDPVGSRKNTHVFQDISEDVGTICDTSSVCASRAWWAFKASYLVPTAVLGSMGSTLKNKLENSYYGIKDWITYDLPDFLDKYDDKPPGTYPDLDSKLSGFYTPPSPAAAPPVGKMFTMSPGGKVWWIESVAHLANTSLAYAQSISPVNAPFPKDSWLTTGPYPQSYTGVMNYRTWDPYRGMYVRKYGVAYHNPIPPNAQVFERMYVTPDTVVIPEDPASPWPIPTGTPAAWNLPGARDAMNNPANQTSPGVKEEIGKVLKDNPGLIDPSTTKLSDAEIAQIAQAVSAELAATNAELAQQIATSSGTLSDQIAANTAVAEAIEAEEDKNAKIDTPALTDAPRHQWQYQQQLSPIIQNCTGIGCKFPFDLMASFSNTWNELVEEPVTPEFNYSYNGTDYNFSLEGYEETASKFRIFLSWIIYILTAVYVIRIYGN